jgi:hypothetical protein
MNTKIRFQHFHEGNDPNHVVRGTAVYATCAALVNVDTGDAIEESWSYCSPNDVPDRKKGRAIAYGRLQKKLNPDFRKNKQALLQHEKKLLTQDKKDPLFV